MNQTEFAVTRFDNRNGVTSWRVTGWLHGVRIRKNFKSKEEAAAEKAVLEIKAEQDASGLRSATTRLTNAQIREAESVYERLTTRPRSLGFYVDFALTNYREPALDKSLPDAIKAYLSIRQADDQLGQLSHRQFTSFRCELRALETVFRGKSVSELTSVQLTEFFRRGLASKKAFNNRRGLVGTFLKFCFLQDWIATNPIEKVPHFRGIGHRRGSAPTLRAYPLERFPIMPVGFRRQRLAFRKRFDLSHDILRHTFISMFVAKFRSMGEAALQAGNSESIIRKHYLDLKTKDEAEAFFAILPQAASKCSLSASKIIPLPTEGLRNEHPLKAG